MFTVRIDHGPNPQLNRTVYSCTGYAVRVTDAGDAVMSLELAAGKEDVPLQGGIAYVMNDHGVTVDVVRARRKP